jgi:HTTM domain
MTFDAALRLTETLLGFALLQQSVEHFASAWDERRLFIPRAGLALLLILGMAPAVTAPALLGLGIVILARFDGPYNGGSDRMSLLILVCLCLALILPDPHWRQVAFGYLAAQLALSYVLSGGVKIVNPEWRSGRALADVFLFSTYPVGEDLRQFAGWPRLLFVMSWCVMLFELLFPLALLTRPTLIIGLAIAAAFHLANACLFGLNRFFWAWLAAYPSILWLQQRIAL